jgi:hypothetical protein
MCDSCNIDSQPLRLFTRPYVVSGVVKQMPPSLYCLPCFRNALRTYKAASVPAPVSHNLGCVTDAAGKCVEETDNRPLIHKTIN